MSELRAVLSARHSSKQGPHGGACQGVSRTGMELRAGERCHVPP